HAEGAKSHGVTQEEKFLRDAKVLEEELARDPDDARSQYYLAQSYKDAGLNERALEAYRKRASMQNGWDEEQFMAQLEVGRICLEMERSEPEVLSALLGAYTLRPTRAEPLFELARYYREKKGYAMATLFAKAGVQTPPPDDRLFLLESVYTWRLLDELAVATYWVQDYATSKSACETVLERVDRGLVVPEADLERIRQNLAEANHELGLSE
ncbi:MAG TPA: hypothetical protein VJV79_11900, partial [Polyangiaceae bacterium]|nr:hypothetical protein [Polyangiaceae bacterium]